MSKDGVHPVHSRGEKHFPPVIRAAVTDGELGPAARRERSLGYGDTRLSSSAVFRLLSLGASERERERERERARERERERERARERERERERGDRQTGKNRQRMRDRGTDKDRQRMRERETDGVCLLVA